jgi:hypothetical protein
MIREYLVNYTYLERAMEVYGFQLMRPEEARERGFPGASGFFEDLHTQLEEDVRRYPRAGRDYGDALRMTAVERDISFLNRYVIFQKVRQVDAARVELEPADAARGAPTGEVTTTTTATARQGKEETEPHGMPKVVKTVKRLQGDDDDDEADAKEEAKAEPAEKKKRALAKKKPMTEAAVEAEAEAEKIPALQPAKKAAAPRRKKLVVAEEEGKESKK